MPCNDGGPWTTANDVAALRTRNDELARDNDVLRELVMRLANAKPGEHIEIPTRLYKQIEKDQVKHRKEDLTRLDKTLKHMLATSNLDQEEDDVLFYRLGRIAAADPKKPLEPQLGFDPNEY